MLKSKKVIFTVVMLVLIAGALSVMFSNNPHVSDSMHSVAFGFVIFGSIGLWIILQAIKGYDDAGRPKSEPGFVCTHCYSRVDPIKVTPGSVALEVLLWLCFLLPGILYSCWRMSARKQVCPVCRSENPVPITSPAGQQLLAQASKYQRS